MFDDALSSGMLKGRNVENGRYVLPFLRYRGDGVVVQVPWTQPLHMPQPARPGSTLVYAFPRRGPGLEPVDLDEIERWIEKVQTISRKAGVDVETAIALSQYRPAKSYWQEYDERRVQVQLDNYTVDKRGIRNLAVDE